MGGAAAARAPGNTMAEVILRLLVERKTFRTARGALPVLGRIELALGAREIVALVGPSGCGKTTLLRIVGGLDADLSDASITVHFSFDDMRGANFSNAHMTVVMANQSMGLLRTEFIGTRLAGANFAGAGLGHVSFRFARLDGARFDGADLSNAEFDGADLTDARFTDAKLQNASFQGATLTRVIGLDPATLSRKGD